MLKKLIGRLSLFAAVAALAAGPQIASAQTVAPPINPNGVTAPYGSFYGLYLQQPLGVTSGGSGGSIGPGAALTAATSAISTSETVLATDPLGSAYLASGTTFNVKLFGTCTSSVANNSTFTLRFGSTGTTADPSIGTFVVAAATSGSAVPFALDIPVTVRTIGSGTSATIYGYGVLSNSGTTGIAASALTVAPLTASTFSSVVPAGILSVSYKSAASTTASTFQNAIISALHP